MVAEPINQTAASAGVRFADQGTQPQKYNPFYQISGDMVIRSSDTDVLITLLGIGRGTEEKP